MSEIVTCQNKVSSTPLLMDKRPSDAHADSTNSMESEINQNDSVHDQNDDEKIQNESKDEKCDIDININDLIRDAQNAIYANDKIEEIEQILTKISGLANIEDLHPLYRSKQSKMENCDKLTLLHIACKKDNIQVAKLLFEKFKFNPNIASSKYKNYPIHIASKLLCENMIELLINAGAIVNVKNKKNQMAINIVGQKYGTKGENEGNQNEKEEKLKHDKIIQCKVLLFNATKKLEQEIEENMKQIELKNNEMEQNDNSKQFSVKGTLKRQSNYQILRKFANGYQGDVKITIKKRSSLIVARGTEYEFELIGKFSQVSKITKNLMKKGWTYQEHSGRTFRNHRAKSNDRKFVLQHQECQNESEDDVFS